MRVALIGSVSSSWHTLRGLLAGNVDICAVLGLDPAHSKGVSDYEDLAPLAQEHNLPYRAFRKISEPENKALLEQQRPDILLVIGISQLIPDDMIAIAPHGGLGFHPTLLPAGRGRAPVAWTIYLDQPAAVNLFFLTNEADAGDIVAQVPVPVEPDDTAQTLITRTNVALEKTILDLAPALRSGNLPRTPQDHSKASWYGRRGPEDGRIDWSQDAAQIHRLIRAASHPYPGAFTTLQGERRIVWNATRADERHTGTLGQIVATDAERGVLVQCGSGHLWLTETSDADGNPLGHDAYRVGARLGHQLAADYEKLAARVTALEEELQRLREKQA